MRLLRLLALRRLRLQPLRAALAILTIGAGVALAASIIVAIASLNASVDESGRALAGPAPLRVIGPTARAGIPTTAVVRIGEVDGVGAAVPMVQAIGLVDRVDDESRPVLALGIDCRLEALIGPFGCQPDLLAADDAVPLVAPALVADDGEDAVLVTDRGRIPLAAALPVAALDELNDGRVVVFGLGRAQAEFARPGAVDVVYIQPEAGASAERVAADIEAELGKGFAVLDATDPPPLVGIVLIIFVPLLTLLALMAMGIGGVLVHNTVALSMEERRRQVAVVGALGGTSRTILATVFAEAAILGVLGGLVGVGLGLMLAGPITATLGNFVESVSGIPLRVHVTPAAVIGPVLVGAAVALVAAWRPARRATRIDVAGELVGRDRIEEAKPAAVARRVVMAAAFTVLGVGLCAVAGSDGGLDESRAGIAPAAFVIASTASLFLAGALVPWVMTIVARISDRGGAGVRLAVANLAREAGRTGVMAVAVAAAVGVGFVTVSYQEAVKQSITESLIEGLDGVSVSTFDEMNNSAAIDANLPPATIDRLAQLPGVARVERGAFVVMGTTTNGLTGLRGFEDPFLDQEVLDGSKDRARFDAGEVLVGHGLARRLGVRAGDQLELDTPNGPVGLPVLGVVLEGDFGGMNVTMPLALLERLYGPQPAGAVTVVPESGVGIDQLADSIRAADLGEGLYIRTPIEVARKLSEGVEEQLAPFQVLQRALLLLAFVAVLSTLLLVGLQRRRELGLLAAVGMAPGQLGSMVVCEAAALAVAGALAGLLTALPMYGALLLIGPVAFGFQNPFVISWSAALVYGLAAVVVAVLGSLLPAWRTARVPVVEALRYE